MLGVDWPVAIVIWIVCGIASLLIAQTKGATNLGSWFLVGLLLGPIGILLAAIRAKPPKGVAVSTGRTGVFCSNCGSPRVAGALFCASCGQPFGSPTSDATSEVAYVEPPSKAYANAQVVLLALIVGGLVVLGWLAVQGTTPGLTDSASVDIPPAGQVWFGQTFDTDTLEITGRRTTVGTTEPFAMVAHLTRSMDASALVMRTSLNGALVSATMVNATGTSDTWGFSPGPLFAAGEWRYDLVDIGGNVLASGTVTAR